METILNIAAIFLLLALAGGITLSVGLFALWMIKEMEEDKKK